jgi:hypothetical protein
MASKDNTVDAKALMASIAKGFKLVPTPKVRAGFKKGDQQLVQADGKTLGMLTLREKGVRVEGHRLAKNITVTDAKGVAEARKLLEAVAQENERKVKEREAKATTQPNRNAGKADTATAKARVAAARTGVKVVAPSGKRARSRNNSRAQVVA